MNSTFSSLLHQYFDYDFFLYYLRMRIAKWASYRSPNGPKKLSAKKGVERTLVNLAVYEGVRGCTRR